MVHQNLLAIEQKQKGVDETRELYRQGYNAKGFEIIMHHIPQTLKKYLDSSHSYYVVSVRYDNRISDKLCTI